MATSVGGIKIKIDNSALVDVINQLQEAKKSLPDFFDMVVTQMGDAAIDYAIPLTRVRTGRLISSYVMSPVVRNGNSHKIVVSNSASEDGKKSYAIYNEFGTRFMAPRLMLTTAKEKVLMESSDLIKVALAKMIRGDSSGRYTFKLN